MPLLERKSELPALPRLTSLFTYLNDLQRAHRSFQAALALSYSHCAFINNAAMPLLHLLQATKLSYIGLLGEFSEILEALDDAIEQAAGVLDIARMTQSKRMLFSISKRIQVYFDLAKVSNHLWMPHK